MGGISIVDAPVGAGTIEVLVVDDHRTVADGIALAIAREPDCECLGTAYGAAEALALAARHRPDVVVMDVRLGSDDGIAVTQQLVARQPGVRVIVLTAFVDQAIVRRAADAGACAVLPKDGSLGDLVEALRTARADDFVVHPSLLRLIFRAADPQRPLHQPLTPREQDVLIRLAEGTDASSIARDLGISLSTCRGYLKNILLKLDAHSQLEAVVVATRLGLISAPQHA